MEIPGPADALKMLSFMQDLAASMFSFSIIPYAGFLYYLTRSKRAPPLALFGFYFLLVFVFGTIPAGIIGGSAVRC